MFPQVVDKRCGRNYALSFEGPESPERPDRANPKVNPLAEEAKGLADVTWPGGPGAEFAPLPEPHGGDRESLGLRSATRPLEGHRS